MATTFQETAGRLRPAAADRDIAARRAEPAVRGDFEAAERAAWAANPPPVRGRRAGRGTGLDDADAGYWGR